MSIETQTTHTEPDAVIPIEADATKESKPKKPKKEAEVKADAGDEEREIKTSVTPEMRELRRNEARTLKDLIESFGQHTHYKCRITRIEPKTYRDRATGKVHQTGGFLEWVEGTPIDEKWLQDRFGGGKYELYFRQRGEKGGMQYGGQVTVEIAGDPDLSALPGIEGQAGGGVAPTAASSESPSIVKDVMGLMKEQIKSAEERAERAGSGRGMDDPLFIMMREQLERAADEKRELLKRLDDLQTAIRTPPQPSAQDRVESRLIDKLVDQDTARLTAQAQKFESEIRMLRENALENERRLLDRAERDRQEMRNAHEREISMMRQSHQNEITTLKTSQETSLAAVRSSSETQVKIAEAENRRLERENERLQDELKELRAKKEKTLLEQVKDINTLKEALGSEESESSTVERVVEAVTNPETIGAVTSIFQRAAPQPAPPPAPARPHRAVVRNKRTGQKMVLEGNQLVPVQPPGSVPGQPQLPPMDPEEIQRIVGYLESACQAGTDPTLVAQSYGSYVPEGIKVAIRDLGGVDQFLTKVAKLPSSSPLLANQAGRNWVKKLGKALTGET